MRTLHKAVPCRGTEGCPPNLLEKVEFVFEVHFVFGRKNGALLVQGVDCGLFEDLSAC